MDVDVLVIGGGLAGLTAALHVKGSVLIVSEGQPNTEKAQGGIAVAFGENDSENLHFKDTIKAGDGLCEEKAVRVLVEEGKEQIKELIDLGLKFDESLNMEAAHSVRRVLHIGDFTGMKILNFVNHLVNDIPRVQARVKGLLLSDGRCCGVLIKENDEFVEITAKTVILATGGYAGLYSKTTNSSSAIGEGVLLAYLAGAELMDLEFIQFHPTVFKNFLISEAVRGEGAVLINDKGERFLGKYPRKELTARDIISRAIWKEILGGRKVFLDVTKIDENYFKQRFSHIYNKCLELGIDPTTQPIPVMPAAHYCMGGVRTDLNARTNVPGLLACGEVACTGVHGANRLASNSLLEALVFGARAGKQACVEVKRTSKISKPCACVVDVKPNKESRQILWETCGIFRDENKLKEGLLKHSGELERLIIKCALARMESRGAHYRRDFPNKWKVPMHSIVRRTSSEVEFIKANA